MSVDKPVLSGQRAQTVTHFAVLGPETYMLEANGVRFIAEQARTHGTAI